MHIYIDIFMQDPNMITRTCKQNLWLKIHKYPQYLPHSTYKFGILQIAEVQVGC